MFLYCNRNTHLHLQIHKPTLCSCSGPWTLCREVPIAGGPRIWSQTSCGTGTWGHNWSQGTTHQALSQECWGSVFDPVKGTDLPPFQKLAICVVVFIHWLGPSFLSCSVFLLPCQFLLSLSLSLFSSIPVMHSFIHFCFHLIYRASVWSIGFHSWLVPILVGPLTWGSLASCPSFSWALPILFHDHSRAWTGSS